MESEWITNVRIFRSTLVNAPIVTANIGKYPLVIIIPSELTIIGLIRGDKSILANGLMREIFPK